MFKTILLSLALIATPIYFAAAEETATEKAGEIVDDAAKNAKKAGRAAADKTCPIVNGRMDCTMKKAKHKMQNAGDEMKDKADDVKKKVD